MRDVHGDLLFAEIVDEAVDHFNGNVEELHKALGLYCVARRFGWKPLLLMSDPRTLKKAEAILGISFRRSFPAVGPMAHLSAAWLASFQHRSFWRCVRGDFPGVRCAQIVQSVSP